MSRPRALDLFCRAGGVSEGLVRAGFDVVGVDLLDCSKAYNRGPGNPERHDRPAQFVQADALEYPLEGFDFIWASPPCQAHSILRKLTPGKEYPDLIPATRTRLAASGIPYAIENVPGAPLGGFLIQLCGTMFGLQTPDGRAELRRHRLFETSWPIALRPACQHGHEGVGECLSVTGTGTHAGGKTRWRDRAVIPVTGHTPVDNRGRREREARKALSISGHAVETSQKQDRNTRRRICAPNDPTGAAAAEIDDRRRTISVTGQVPQAQVVTNAVRETFSTDDARHAMGIDWMAMKDLSQAIPPAYAEWIGRQALDVLAASTK